MNLLKQIAIGPWLALALSQPSLGQSDDYATSTVKENAAAESNPSWKEPASRDYSFSGLEKSSVQAKKARVNNLSFGKSQAEIFTRKDLASFSVYTPTPNINRSLSFAKSVSNSQIDGVWVNIIQALSLVATRQVNTEFSYSLPVNKNSKFDSTFSYRLSPTTDSGRSGMITSFWYNGKF